MGSVDRLVEDTSVAVTSLIRQNRELRSQNLKLQREVERLSAGWDEIRRLARLAPRTRGDRRRAR
jgi:hypothetical protein